MPRIILQIPGVLAEIILRRGLDTDVIVAHRSEVDIELEDLILGQILFERHCGEPLLNLTGCGVLVLTAYQLDRLLCDGGAAVCGFASVRDSRKHRASDPLEVDSGMGIETLILNCDDGFVYICVSYITVGDVDPVDILAARKLRHDIAFAVIDE